MAKTPNVSSTTGRSAHRWALVPIAGWLWRSVDTLLFSLLDVLQYALGRSWGACGRMRDASSFAP